MLHVYMHRIALQSQLHTRYYHLSILTQQEVTESLLTKWYLLITRMPTEGSGGQNEVVLMLVTETADLRDLLCQ